MRVMITGATTPIGRALIDRLRAGDDRPFILAVGQEDDPEPLPRDVRYVAADLTRPRQAHDLVWGAARQHSIDTVFHGAHHRAVRDRGARVHAQNVAATRHVLQACTDHPSIRRFVYRSFAEVYALERQTSELLDEDAPLDFEPAAPQWLRDRVEGDLTVCAHFGGPLELTVLRLAEIVAPACGSQLWDYLQSLVCLRPLGFDPVINVLSLEDAADAIALALHARETGVFNIPGADTLPLSRAILESNRADIPLPGPLLAPLYGLRRWIAGFEFRYDMNLRRFHFGGMLEGQRARTRLGYTPHHPVSWPSPWWRTRLARLAPSSR